MTFENAWEPSDEALALARSRPKTSRAVSCWVRETPDGYVLCTVYEPAELPGWWHLHIGYTTDERPSWYDLMALKDQLCGLSSTAIEVYPPRDEVRDTGPCIHLWVVPGGVPVTLTRDQGGLVP